MTEVDERPTIGERYASAVGRGANRDVILAAGMQRSYTGALLLRLVAEYDLVRGDLERAGSIKPRQADRARELLADAERYKAAAFEAPTDESVTYYANRAKAATEEAARIMRRQPDEIVSARAFILIELKTLRAAKERVAALALRMAEKRQAVEKTAALKLAGRVLETYLDPVCHHCDGTKKIGNRYAGETERECKPCRGTGTRRDIIGNGPAETTFAAVLFGELQRQASEAASGMRKALSSDAAAVTDADILGRLKSSLTSLRREDSLAD